MTEWTTRRSQDRLELAADVMRALPGVKPQGYFNAWPEYLHSFGDKVGQEPRMRRPRPGPRQISQAEETLLWLRWLEVEDARLVWAAGQRHAMEGDLLGVRDQPGDGGPALPVRAGGDRLAAERQASAGEAVDDLRDREGAGRVTGPA